MRTCECACAVAFGLVLGSAFTAAQAPKTQTDTCRKPTTQLELSQCGERKFRDADAELQKSYDGFLKVLTQRLADKAAEDLKASQVAWTRYRELQCHAEAGQYDGGSLKDTMFSACMESLTRARIKQLDDTYNDK
jgi:uncharacterized protein YecT (DUF1311 family)